MVFLLRITVIDIVVLLTLVILKSCHAFTSLPFHSNHYNTHHHPLSAATSSSQSYHHRYRYNYLKSHWYLNNRNSINIHTNTFIRAFIHKHDSSITSYMASKEDYGDNTKATTNNTDDKKKKKIKTSKVTKKIKRKSITKTNETPAKTSKTKKKSTTKTRKKRKKKNDDDDDDDTTTASATITKKKVVTKRKKNTKRKRVTKKSTTKASRKKKTKKKNNTVFFWSDATDIHKIQRVVTTTTTSSSNISSFHTVLSIQNNTIMTNMRNIATVSHNHDHNLDATVNVDEIIPSLSSSSSSIIVDDSPTATAIKPTKSIYFTIRGNPLPLQRHRTYKNFVYNPSALKQKQFYETVLSTLHIPQPTPKSTPLLNVHNSNKNNNNNIISEKVVEEHLQQHGVQVYMGQEQEIRMEQLQKEEEEEEVVVTVEQEKQQEPQPFFTENDFLHVKIIFHLKRPKIHFIASRPGPGRIKPKFQSSQFCQSTRVDVDNLAKFVLDSLNGVLYVDDRQIVELHVRKCFDNGDDDDTSGGGECLGKTQVWITKLEEEDER